MIAPVLVAPAHDYVISLEPEFITPTDGADKQHRQAGWWLCRSSVSIVTLSGAKRWALRSIRRCMAACSLWLREHHCNFIMVCLPQSHSFLYEQVADLTKLNAVSQVVVKRWTYHFVNDVLLRDSADAMTVNWCELIITRDDTQAQLYQDGRYGCPLAMAGEQDAVCPVHHHNWEKGGCLTTLPTSIGNHVRHELDRQSDEFRRIYRLRTASERINSQALDLGSSDRICATAARLPTATR